MSSKDIVGDIGARLNEFMQTAGIRQKDLVDKLNLTSASVSMMCNGKTKPSVSTITLICRTYHVNETWLRTGEGEMFVGLQRVDEISDFFKRVLNADMSDKGEAALQTFITALARLSPEQLETAAELIDAFMDSYQDIKKEGQE